MYGGGYGLGLIVATMVGIIIEYLRHKHNKDRIALKQQQIREREHKARESKKKRLLEKMSIQAKSKSRPREKQTDRPQ